MLPTNLNPVATFGFQVATHVSSPLVSTFRLGGTVGTTLVLGLVIGAAVSYRAFRGSKLVSTNPRIYRALYEPWVGPLGLITMGYGLCLSLPYYMPLAASIRPQTWWDWGTLPPSVALTTTGIAFVAIVAGVTTIVRRSTRAEKSMGPDFEDSRWARWRDVAISPNWSWSIPIQIHYRGTTRYWRSRDAGNTVIAPETTDTHRHILLVGQTGSGKGHCVFNPIIESTKHPICYQDVKGQCPGKDHLEKRFGVEMIRFGCAAADGWSSMCWNALEECRNDPRPADAFAALAEALIPSNGEHDWVAKLTRPILAWVLQHSGYKTLSELQDANVREGVENVVSKAGVPNGLIQALEGQNVKQYMGTTIFSALACYRDGWGREVTGAHDFSLDDVCKRGCYVLSAEPTVSQRTPLVVFWRMLFRKLLQSSKPVPLTMLFDEALAAGKIPSVRDALSTLRDREVSIVFGTQHLSGLREVYGDAESESLIASFSARIWLLSGLDERDREHISKVLGKRTIPRKQGKDTVPVVVPLMTLAELNRRANQTRYMRVNGKLRKVPVFWAIIDGPGFTKGGEPVIGKFLGGKTDFIRRPTVKELEMELQTPIAIDVPHQDINSAKPADTEGDTAELLPGDYSPPPEEALAPEQILTARAISGMTATQARHAASKILGSISTPLIPTEYEDI